MGKVYCIVCIFTIQHFFCTAAGQFATKINQITRNLNLVVASLNVNVNYTDFEDNATYHSSTKFHSGGMKGLYNLTDLFINVIAPDDILMDGKSATILRF